MRKRNSEACLSSALLEYYVDKEAIERKLLDDSSFVASCDSVHICLDLWKKGKDDPLEYIQKAAQRTRLKEKGQHACIPFCHTPDSTKVLPAYISGEIVNINN